MKNNNGNGGLVGCLSAVYARLLLNSLRHRPVSISLWFRNRHKAVEIAPTERADR